MTRGDRVIRAGLVVSLTVVTAVAVVISYGHLYDLATKNGEKGVAAAVLPVTVDGLILACSLVIVNAARQRSRPPFLAWLLLLAGIGATLAGNIAHGIEHGWAGSLVAGWPAVVAGGMFHLAIGEIRRGRETAPQVTDSTVGADLPQADEPWTDDQPDGYALWEFIEPTPEPVATGGPDQVLALETVPVPLRGDGAGTGANPAPDPELEPVVATARDRFAEVIAAGRVPSVRSIRRECNVGYPRAVQVLEALQARA